MISKLIQILKFSGSSMEPCNKKEIDQLEELYGFRFPDIYREFLNTMGREAQNFMTGSLFLYKDLQLINEEAILLLKENCFRELPKKAFVFWMHQGYQFAFFLMDEGKNPPIYYFNETLHQTDFVRSFESLSEFYESELQMALDAGFLKTPMLGF